MNWNILKAEIDAENARVLRRPPEDVLRVFKYEILDTAGGTGGLMLGPWLEGASASRYIGPYYIYNIIKLAGIPTYTAQNINAMAQLLLPKAVGTARLCGMATYASFCQRVLRAMQALENQEHMLSLLNALYLYGSTINAWIHHYMKWGVGEVFRIPTRRELMDMGMRNVESFV